MARSSMVLTSHGSHRATLQLFGYPLLTVATRSHHNLGPLEGLLGEQFPA